MKTAKLSLMFLACTAALPAFAQNTTDSRCGTTNLDRQQGIFTIVKPMGTTNQQCFVTVVPKQSWSGGMPDLASSQLVEGNYRITLSGGGGGGGAGADRVGGGGGGAGAVPVTVVRYLQPGVYRLTIGSGGEGGRAPGGHGGDGAPTSLSNTQSNEVVAGFSGAELWSPTYASSTVTGVAGRRAYDAGLPADGSGGQGVGGQSSGGRGGLIGADVRAQDGGRLMNVAEAGAPGRGGRDLSGRRFRIEVAGGGGGGAGFGNGGNGDSSAEDGKAKTGAVSGVLGGGGGGGAGGEGVSDAGAPGGHGFIKLAFADPVPQAAPAPSPAPAVAPSTQSETTRAPVAARPARKDRN